MRSLLFDLETTGLQQVDRVVEVALLLVEEGRILANLTSYVRPPALPPDPSWMRYTAVRPEMLTGAPTFADLAPTIIYALALADEWVGYGLPFDIRFLRQEFARLHISLPIRKEVDLLRHVGEKMKLEEACERFRIRLPGDHVWHLASHDLVATYLLWQKLRLRDGDLEESASPGSFRPI